MARGWKDYRPRSDATDVTPLSFCGDVWVAAPTFVVAAVIGCASSAFTQTPSATW